MAAGGLVQVPEDVVDGLQPDRQAHQVRRHAGGLLVGFAQLAVGGRCRMDHQGLGVADVGQVRAELQGVDEALAGFLSTLDAEAEQRAGARMARAAQVALRQRMAGALGQARIVDPGHARMLLRGAAPRPAAFSQWRSMRTAGSRCPAAAARPIHRRQRRAERAQRLHAGLHGEAEVAEGFVEAHAVIALRGLGHLRELAVVPGELARLDDHAAHGGAVAAEELGGRMHDDVGAVLDRPAQIGRGEGVVDHQRHAGSRATWPPRRRCRARCRADCRWSRRRGTSSSA
jgi:hypothetical protein